MSKKKWLLLIIILLIGLTVWYCLFYKSYSKNKIANSADIVLSIDVKRNANTILKYFITTPSAWSLGSMLSSKDSTELSDWKDAIKIPDYIFIFHAKNQPSNIYYTILDIKDNDEFDEIVKENNFKEEINKNNISEYYSSKLGIGFIKNESKILIGSLSVNDNQYLQAIANEIFNKKEYIKDSTLKKITDQNNHLSIYLQKNEFLSEDAFINGDFRNGELILNTSLQPKNEFNNFTETDFELTDSSLMNLLFIQPPPNAYALISTQTKETISTAIGFNIDSFLLPQNKKYSLDIASIKDKIDSAVSYTYDDDFNKIENIIVNKIQEPSLNFSIFSNDNTTLLNYWKKNKNIQLNDTANLFVSIPFVKTYVENINNNILSLTSYNYLEKVNNKRLQCLAYLNVSISKIPINLTNYLPEEIAKLTLNLESLNCIATKKNKAIEITLSIKNNNKNKPFLLSID